MKPARDAYLVLSCRQTPGRLGQLWKSAQGQDYFKDPVTKTARWSARCSDIMLWCWKNHLSHPMSPCERRSCWHSVAKGVPSGITGGWVPLTQPMCQSMCSFLMFLMFLVFLVVVCNREVYSCLFYCGNCGLRHKYHINPFRALRDVKGILFPPAQVAFHPFKSESSWQRCMQHAGGWGGICICTWQPNLVVQYPRNRIPRPRTSKNIQEHPRTSNRWLPENPWKSMKILKI